MIVTKSEQGTIFESPFVTLVAIYTTIYVCWLDCDSRVLHSTASIRVALYCTRPQRCRGVGKVIMTIVTGASLEVLRGIPPPARFISWKSSFIEENLLATSLCFPHAPCDLGRILL